MSSTRSFELGFNPIWYIADIVGRPLGGGSMYATSSLNPTVQKFIFMDPGGQNVWPNPVLFNENGQQGPFYFEFDTDTPEDTYFLQVFDAQGNLVWTMDDYSPNSGGSGGTDVTITQNVQNLLVNNVFWRHIPNVAAISSTGFRVAPGVHSALANTPANLGTDIWFYKTNTTATDSLTFPAYTFGSNFLTNDTQPVDYLQYACSVAGSAETFKYIQIPITQGVQNLANNTVTLTLWAISNSGLATTLQPQWCQFFGDGAGATPTITTPITTLNVTTSWTKFVVTTTIPSVALSPAAIVGGCHNDGLFLQIQFPLNATCTIGMTKPCVFLGTITQPGADYQPYDVIDGVINAPRTGHVVPGLDATAPPGYLRMDDTTIGSASSVATTARNETFPLYNLIWNATNANGITQSYAPVTGGRGSSAIADFTANKPMQILYALGAVIGNAGQASSTFYGNPLGFGLCQPFGSDQIALNAAQLPPHSHTYAGLFGIIPGGVATGTPGFATATLDTGLGPGSSALVIVDQPTVRFNYFIKL